MERIDLKTLRLQEMNVSQMKKHNGGTVILGLELVLGSCAIGLICLTAYGFYKLGEEIKELYYNHK